MFVYNFIVIDAPNREGAPDWPDFMYSGKLFPTGLLNICLLYTSAAGPQSFYIPF